MSDADTDAGPSHDAEPVTAAEFREASRTLSAGANKAFNSIFSQLEATKADALSKMQTTAAIAPSSLLSNLTGLTSELRGLLPEALTLPNINLQAELTDLAGIVDTTQAANLLSEITTNFSDALTSAGFELGTLISDAEAAIAEGKSLSGIIPNFEIDAAGLGEAFQKAVNVKMPDIDPISEIAATFTSNSDFLAAKTAAQDAIKSVTDLATLPTVDDGIYRIASEVKNITQSFDGLSITQQATTPLDAFLGGISKRATISPSGFSNRPTGITETFSDATNVVLAQTPVRIELVQGRTSSTETIKGTEVDTFKLNPQGIGRIGKLYRPDTYTLSGKTVTIDQTVRQYDNSTWAIKVTYRYNDTYDPTYAI